MNGAVTMGAVPLTNGQATFNKVFVSDGTKSITAIYSGDSNFTGSSASALSQQIAQASTTTPLTSSMNPSAVGQSVRFTAPKQTVKISMVIVGGGIAGLSVAWRLQKKGFTDFVLLEMNDQAGGNSRWGENEVTAYPWAAHYVPVPVPKAVYVREHFEDFGHSRIELRHTLRHTENINFGKWLKRMVGGKESNPQRNVPRTTYRARTAYKNAERPRSSR